jgi:MSHA biogenesis protein MshN
MSLINDMLRDLDRRNQQPAVLGNTGALQAQAPGNLPPETYITHELRLPDIEANMTQVADAGTPATRAEGTTGVPAITGRDSDSRQPRTRAEKPVATRPALPAGEPVVEDTAHIVVTPRPLSAEQQLAHDFHAAASAVSAGNHIEAERLLEDLLARDNGQHQARLLLAGLYMQQQRNSRAESVLASGLLHYPQHAPYARLYAQLLATQARDSEAINILRGALPAAGEDAEYHALLAGLYQRSGKPEAAADSYRGALRLAPAHGEWWMGLGISSEQAGDVDTATTAYRQALHYPLTATLQQYVQQRLAQLAP